MIVIYPLPLTALVLGHVMARRAGAIVVVEAICGSFRGLTLSIEWCYTGHGDPSLLGASPQLCDSFFVQIHLSCDPRFDKFS